MAYENAYVSVPIEVEVSVAVCDFCGTKSALPTPTEADVVDQVVRSVAVKSERTGWAHVEIMNPGDERNTELMACPGCIERLKAKA